MISVLFLKPFIWIACDPDSVKPRLILLILSIVAWVGLIIFLTVFLLVIVGLSSTHASANDNVTTYVWPIVAGLVIMALFFINSVWNFYIEKRDEKSSESEPLL